MCTLKDGGCSNRGHGGLPARASSVTNKVVPARRLTSRVRPAAPVAQVLGQFAREAVEHGGPGRWGTARSRSREGLAPVVGQAGQGRPVQPVTFPLGVVGELDGSSGKVGVA